jgi:hypothetical protein
MQKAEEPKSKRLESPRSEVVRLFERSAARHQRVIPGADDCGWWARVVENHGGLQMENQAYTVAAVAALTGFSGQTITRMFERERSILIVG